MPRAESANRKVDDTAAAGRSNGSPRQTAIPHILEHVAQYGVAFQRQDRFRVELEAGLLRFRVADRHRHPVDLGMHAEAGGQVAGAQAVIAADAERRLEPAQRPFAVMSEQRGFAVHRLGRAGDLAAGLLDDRLVTEADAEQGQIAPGARDQLKAAAGVAGLSRPDTCMDVIVP
jgi:hypothetical protein